MSTGDSLLGVNIACSSSGTYVSICSNGSILVSANFGASTTNVSITSTSASFAVVYAIAMSSSGQYQTAISTGVPASYIYVSTDYGVTWNNNQTVSTNNAIVWAESICMSASGQYQYAGGGGGTGSVSYYSTTYGASWTSLGIALNRPASGILLTSAQVFTIDSLSNTLKSILLTSGTPAETTVSAATTAMTAVVPKRLTTDGASNIAILSVTSTAFAYSINSGTSFTVGTSPAIFIYAAFSGTTLWACSSTNMYSSTNFGTTWTIQTPTYLSIRSFAVSSDNSKLYVLTSAGQLNVQTNSLYSTLSPTTLSYLTNITSNVQTQINNTQAWMGNSVAVGVGALSSIPTWAGSVAVGTQSLPVCTGTFNTGIGTNALLSLTTGTYNVALGANAGQYPGNTSTYNTWVGTGAGPATSNATAFTYSTALGAGAITTASNQIMLGRAAETVVIPGALTVTGIAGNVTGNLTTTGIINAIWQTSNVAIGGNALLGALSGAYSVAVGIDALKTGATSAYFNTAVGYQSLRLCNGANSNTAVGYQSLTASTTGNSNSAFGATALTANTTGSYNNAFGNSASQYTTTGNNNCSFGTNANQNTTIGNNNCSFGNNANQNTTIGSNNCSFGTSALNLNTIGNINCAFGMQALTANTTGNTNCAFGMQALTANTTGINNSAFGGYSLTNNTIGNNISAFGMYAGQISTGSNSTCLGYFANTGAYTQSTAIGYNSAATAANQIMMGTSAEYSIFPGGIDLSSNIIFLKTKSDVNHTLAYSITLDGPVLQGYTSVRLQQNSGGGNTGTLTSSGFTLSTGTMTVPALTVSGLSILNSSSAPLIVAQALYTYSTWPYTSCGLQIGWNNTLGGGRTDFCSNGQAGGGGFDFWALNVNNTSKYLLATLNSSALTLNNLPLSLDSTTYNTIYTTPHIGYYGSGINGIQILGNSGVNISCVNNITGGLTTGGYVGLSVMTNNIKATLPFNFNSTAALNSNILYIKGSNDSAHTLQYNSGIDGAILKAGGSVQLAASNGGVTGLLSGSGFTLNSGTMTAPTFNATSDYRVKANVETLDSRFSVDKLRPVFYTQTEQKAKCIGFIAHELQEHFPYLVDGKKDGDTHQSINYIGLIGVLTHEIQELKCREAARDAEIQELRSAISTLMLELTER